jgi:Ca-activated chloride channel family protein
VVLTVSVTNKRLLPFSGLSKEAFTITDEKTPREITSFSSGGGPHSIGVILDMSGSMSGNKLAAQAALFFDDFLKASHQSNEYFIMAFTERPHLLVDWTTDISGLLRRLVEKETGGQTALYDSLYLAIEKAKTGRHKQRAVILITDGSDNLSRYTYGEVRELLKESDVMLYGIYLNQGSDPGSPLAAEGKSGIFELTSITGGRGFSPLTKKEMKEVFDALAAEMRNQYRVGFKPLPVTGKPKWRSVKVKVTPPENAPPEFRHLIVRSREGYYPDKRPL